MPAFSANISDRHSVSALLQKERLFGRPRALRPSSLTLPPAAIDAQTLAKNYPVLLSLLTTINVVFC